MLHPLLLPGVLEVLLDYLIVKDVKNCRKVCFQWNIEACKILRRKQTITLRTLNSMIELKELIIENKIKSVDIPFSVFELRFKVGKQDISAIESFFTDIGEDIKSLYLTIGSGFFEAEQLVSILQKSPNIELLQLQLYYSISPRLFPCDEFIPFLPSIKHLALEVVGYECVEETAESFLHDFFSAAVNLETISYSGNTKRTPSKFKILITNIILSSPCGTLKKLSNIEYLMRLDEESLQILILKSFPLQTLHIEMWITESNLLCVTTSSLEILMTQLKFTLRKLSIEFPSGNDITCTFQFPGKMPNLYFLSLDGFEGSLKVLLKNLPSLHTLEISQVSLENGFPRSKSTNNSSPLLLCSNLTNLKIEFCTDQFPSVFRRLSKYFPSLQKLKVTHATNEMARAIYKEMPSIRNLSIQGSELSDEGICGIPDDVSKDENLCNNLFRSDVNNLRRYSVMSDLKDLQKLELDAHLVTDVGIVYGITGCKNLELLALNFCEVTDATINAVEVKLGRKRSFESETRVVI